MKASEWSFDRTKEAFVLVAKDKVEHMKHCARDHVQKYCLLAANHCARRRTRRCHNVVLVPELQQFPFGRLRLVGHCRKESHQLVVVRFVEKKVRSDATEQALGRTNRRKR